MKKQWCRHSERPIVDRHSPRSRSAFDPLVASCVAFGNSSLAAWWAGIRWFDLHSGGLHCFNHYLDAKNQRIASLQCVELIKLLSDSNQGAYKWSVWEYEFNQMNQYFERAKCDLNRRTSINQTLKAPQMQSTVNPSQIWVHKAHIEFIKLLLSFILGAHINA